MPQNNATFLIIESSGRSRLASPHSRLRARHSQRTRVPDIPVKVLLVHRSEEDLEHFRVRHSLRLKAESLSFAGPGLSVHLWVGERNTQLKIVAVQTAPTFQQTHAFTEWHSPLVAPKP